MNLILKFLLLSLCGLILTALPVQADLLFGVFDGVKIRYSVLSPDYTITVRDKTGAKTEQYETLDGLNENKPSGMGFKYEDLRHGFVKFGTNFTGGAIQHWAYGSKTAVPVVLAFPEFTIYQNCTSMGFDSFADFRAGKPSSQSRCTTIGGQFFLEWDSGIITDIPAVALNRGRDLASEIYHSADRAGSLEWLAQSADIERDIVMLGFRLWYPIVGEADGDTGGRAFTVGYGVGVGYGDFRVNLYDCSPYKVTFGKNIDGYRKYPAAGKCLDKQLRATSFHKGYVLAQNAYFTYATKNLGWIQYSILTFENTWMTHSGLKLNNDSNKTLEIISYFQSAQIIDVTLRF